MDDPHPFVIDLRERMKQRQVVVVVGSGVSIATTDAAPTWRGLIESAVKRCVVLGEPQEWCQGVSNQLNTTFPDFMLAAAELVHQKLRDRGEGEVANWLRDTCGNLRADRRSLIEAIAQLDLPVVTTNYDGLIEEVTGLEYATWVDSRHVGRVMHGDERRILHLHGHWDRPESVVLGIRSYEAVQKSEHTQAVMRALAMTKRLLFVGCGHDGLSDPNWGNFLTWLEKIEEKAEHRHYRLVLECDKFQPRGRLYPLVYGEKHEDLPGFLAKLCPPSEEGSEKPSSSVVLPTSPQGIQHYLTRLTEETQHLTLIGMGRSLQIELPINEAYVPLSARMARALELREKGRFEAERAEHEEEVDLSQVFRRVGELKLRGVILLGEPGSGKTTGARQLAWRLASRQCLPRDLGLPDGITPVFLRFRNLTRETLAKKSGLKDFLLHETHCDEAPEGCTDPGSDLWNGKAGGLLWILDGLDEVVDAATRRKVSGWIQKAIKNRPQDWFLVTCRFQGYFRDGVPLGPKFVEFHVRPLSDDEIQDFVEKWFLAAHGKLSGPGPRTEERARQDIKALLDILARPAYQTGHMRELCTNPLLLTILCLVFHEERELPTGRAELYGHCIRVLLEYWRKDIYESELGKKLEPYNADAAESVLARIAWWLHQERDRTSAPFDELAEEAARGLAKLTSSSGLGRDGREFLHRMRDESGILAMEGDGRCGFLHLSFQEYLAANHAVREGYAEWLASRAAQSWWREVALLSLRSTRSYCEAFYREMLRVGIPEKYPELAEQCLAEALYFEAAPFVEALSVARPEPGVDWKYHFDRLAAVLRLVRDRGDQVPELKEISRRLLQSEDQPEEGKAVRGFAREIQSRLNVAVESEAGQPNVVVDQRTGIAFVEVPAGEFMMGSVNGESHEKPVHRVKISEPFLLAKYPVTNVQYRQFLEATGRAVENPHYLGDRRFGQPEQPVVGVSWKNAQAFCNWAGFRLPTEAEWEYACRAGATSEYSFGDDPSKLGEYAWFDENSDGQTQPVGAKKPNAWGLHDMHGNVWEWCQDGAYRRYNDEPQVDPLGPEGAALRVIRGGSWRDVARSCRAACRSGNEPRFRSIDLGFRVAAVPSGGAGSQKRGSGAESGG